MSGTDPMFSNGASNGDGDRRVACVLQLFEALTAAGIPHALIHGSDDLAAAAASDVDLALGERPDFRFLDVLRRVAVEQDFLLVNVLHYEIPHGHYFILADRQRPADFLHLDCLYDPEGVNRYRVPTPFLLEERHQGPGLPRVRQDRMAAYLLIKRSIKGQMDRERLQELRTLMADHGEAVTRHLLALVGINAGDTVRAIAGAQDDDTIARALGSFRHQLDQHSPGPWQDLRRRFLSARRQLGRLLQPTGYFLVVVGPDGCGKSTVTADLLQQLDRAFRHVHRFHWRPGFLPKLGRSAPAEGGSPAPPSGPSRYRGVVSLARFAYYSLDFVAGYWLRLYPRRARTTLLLGERYFTDVRVNPARYGFAVPDWLSRFAAAFVPRPDLTVLLTHDPAVIHHRKPELPEAEIADQLRRFTAELPRWGSSLVVKTDVPPDAVAATIAGRILEDCAARTGHRFPRGAAVTEWRAFPGRRQPRVLVGPGDTVAGALRLYSPYSPAGRALKAVLTRLPDALARWLLPATRPAAGMPPVDDWAAMLRDWMDEPAARISVSPGTPGPHRKATAQVTLRGQVIAYGKLAESPAAAALLRNEATVLGELAARDNLPFSLPTLLGLREVGGLTTLLQSSAPPRAQPRPLALDGVILETLSALGRVHPDSLPLASLPGVASLPPPGEDSVRAQCRAFLENRLGAGALTSLGHGDFAPWNLRTLEDGRLYVFDWEYAGPGQALLSDLCHYIFMPGVLVKGLDPRAAVEALWQALHEERVLAFVAGQGAEAHQLPAYLLLYLLGLEARQVQLGRDRPGYLDDCLHHVLVRAGHPGTRPRVLVAAYACEPGQGSEPGVGWQMAQAISQEHEAWVVTRANNRAVIEAELARAPNPHLHFVYVDLPPWARFWKKGGRGVRTYYYLWQLLAARESRRLLRTVSLDLAHHVTFVNDWMYTFLALVPLPFVWGPVGSNPPMPAGLAPDRRTLIKDRLRFAVQTFFRSADPLYWMSYRRARLILAINQDIARQFPFSLGRVPVMAQAAIGVEDIPNLRGSSRGGEGLRVVSVGKLIPIKGWHLTVPAFAHLHSRSPQSTLSIIGDGPLRTGLEESARHLGVDGAIEFSGWLDRNEALHRIADADVLLFPSFEGAGMVVLEAMALGLPVVCLDFGGPGQMAAGACGISVPAGDLQGTVAALGDALATYAMDRTLLDQHGHAAREAALGLYLWRNRDVMIREWYRTVLQD